MTDREALLHTLQTISCALSPASRVTNEEAAQELLKLWEAMRDQTPDPIEVGTVWVREAEPYATVGYASQVVWCVDCASPLKLYAVNQRGALAMKPSHEELRRDYKRLPFRREEGTA